MLFETVFFIGLLGFVATMLLGFMHGHGDHGGDHGGGHAHVGHAEGHGHAALGHHHADALPAHAPGADHHGAHDAHHGAATSGGPLMAALTLFSPMNIFATCLAMGGIGVLLQSRFTFWLTFLLAAAGGIAFTVLIVRPLFRLLLGFSSKPSQGLEGTIATMAEAASSFDASGRGLVKVVLDGEIVQLLGQLAASEVQTGRTVHKGDQIVITDVDAKRGVCTVSNEWNA